MGMAASQARFLQLTARKTNLEYMGQQINQERLALANESAGLFERQLTMDPPTPPSSLDDTYYSPAYTFVDPVSGIQKKFVPSYSAAGEINGATLEYNQYQPDGTYSSRSDTLQDNAGAADSSNPYRSDFILNTAVNDIGPDLSWDSSTGRLEQIVMSIYDASTASATDYTLDLTYSPEFDEDAFNDDMNEYEYKKATYDYEIERINLETERIQKQDKSLELKMKQIDTEHKAISTEIDAVQKVIQKGIDSTFKTFS